MAGRAENAAGGAGRRGIPAALALKARLAVTVASARGTGHAQNEDSVLVFPEAGLFCVADGLGGHVDGQLASRAVTTILERSVSPEEDLAGRVAAVEKALAALNGALLREAEWLSPGGVIGSTVVALVLDEAYGTVMWAGDSRLYLARAGYLFQLTRDHAFEDEHTTRTSTMLTRAIGSRAELELDEATFAVEAGDAMLLCSDGLTGALTSDEINDRLGDMATDAASLVEAARARGARDDVSAIVVRLGAARVDSPGQGG